MLTDIECGGGFYVRSLVDDLGKGRKAKKCPWKESKSESCIDPVGNSLFYFRPHPVLTIPATVRLGIQEIQCISLLC